jgi:hypothetical protein
MYTITEITGKVGGTQARTLLEVGQPVRVLVRDARRDRHGPMRDVASVRDEGVIRSFLTPADKSFAVVATEDIGRIAAELIQQNWTGKWIV